MSQLQYKKEMKDVNSEIIYISICKWWGTVTLEAHYSSVVHGPAASIPAGSLFKKQNLRLTE